MDIHCRFLPVTDAPEPRILDKQGAPRYIRHMKAQLIYNPAAGRRSVADDLPPVVAFLESKGWYVSMRTTLGPGDGITYAREAVAEGYDMAVAVGGDGTLGEVATGLASSDCTLGVLPTGTGNVWAHMLGLPQWTPMSRSGLMQAARVLVEGQVYRIDLGKAGDRCFALWAGIGLDAQVAQEVGPQGEMRRSLGNFLAYLVTLASQSISLRGTRMTVVIDGKAVRQRVVLILVSNAQLYGPSVSIAPQAQLDDGMLDVYIFKGGNVLDVARHIVMILSGKHLQDPKVECYRAKQVEVRGEEPLPLHTDGDPIGHTPVTITVLPKALRVVVPRWAPSSLFQDGGPGGRKPPSLAQRIAERLRYERERWRGEGERLRHDRAHRMRVPPRD